MRALSKGVPQDSFLVAMVFNFPKTLNVPIVPNSFQILLILRCFCLEKVHLISSDWIYLITVDGGSGLIFFTFIHHQTIPYAIKIKLK